MRVAGSGCTEAGEARTEERGAGVGRRCGRRFPINSWRNHRGRLLQEHTGLRLLLGLPLCQLHAPEPRKKHHQPNEEQNQPDDDSREVQGRGTPDHHHEPRGTNDDREQCHRSLTKGTRYR